MLILSIIYYVNIGLQGMIEISFRLKQRFRHAKPFNRDKQSTCMVHSLNFSSPISIFTAFTNTKH